MKNKPWKQEEVQFLKENYFELGSSVSKILGRSRSAVKTKARKLGLRSHHHLTPEQKLYIENNIDKPRQEIADDLGLPVKKVNSYVWNKKISKISFKYFTPEEDEYVRKHYATKSYKEIGDALGRSESSIKRHARDILKLFRTPEEGRKIQEQKSKATQFKSGNEPHNTKYDGALSVRKEKSGTPYIYIRVAKGKWELLHRKIWEKHHGPIPKGYNVIFKDGNQANVDIENLELVSNQELMQRNGHYNRDPEELTKLIQASGALQRQINKIIHNEQQQ
ncbi:MAG: HNH endonuclease [Bacteroidota bacterium]